MNTLHSRGSHEEAESIGVVFVDLPLDRLTRLTGEIAIQPATVVFGTIAECILLGDKKISVQLTWDMIFTYAVAANNALKPGVVERIGRPGVIVSMGIDGSSNYIVVLNFPDELTIQYVIDTVGWHQYVKDATFVLGFDDVRDMYKIGVEKGWAVNGNFKMFSEGSGG